MAQWATTALQATQPYSASNYKSGHKVFYGTVLSGSSWDGSGSSEESGGGEHSYIF